MLIPENIIQQLIKDIVVIINNDYNYYNNLKHPEQSLLYNLFYSDDYGNRLVMGKFDYYEQAKKILIKDGSDPRQLVVTLAYNQERVGLPTVHILLPAESPAPKGLGFGDGYWESDQLEDGTVQDYYNYSYDVTYNLMITSDNSSEVVLIYNFIKTMFVALFQSMEFRGLRNPSFNGQDLQFTNDLIPASVFHRNLTLSFFYENRIPEIFRDRLINKINFQQEIILDEVTYPFKPL